MKILTRVFNEKDVVSLKWDRERTMHLIVKKEKDGDGFWIYRAISLKDGKRTLFMTRQIDRIEKLEEYTTD